MKIPQLLLAGCALLSWTTLNAKAGDFDQGIPPEIIRHIVQQIRVKAKNDTKQIQPGLVASWKSAKTTDRSFDPAALRNCNQYSDPMLSNECLRIIADRSFDPNALESCNRYSDPPQSNECLRLIRSKSLKPIQ